MANIDLRDFEHDIDSVRRRARMGGHVQRAQTMLIAAGLSALGMVAVAGAMLTRLF